MPHINNTLKSIVFVLSIWKLHSTRKSKIRTRVALGYSIEIILGLFPSSSTNLRRIFDEHARLSSGFPEARKCLQSSVMTAECDTVVRERRRANGYLGTIR